MQRFLKYFVLAILASISLYLFNAIYEASSEVIDELFHLGQGFEYCMGNFSTVSWHAICLHFPGLLCIDFSVGPEDHNFSWTLSSGDLHSRRVLRHLRSSLDPTHLLYNQRFFDSRNKSSDLVLEWQAKRLRCASGDGYHCYIAADVLLLFRVLH